MVQKKVISASALLETAAIVRNKDAGRLAHLVILMEYGLWTWQSDYVRGWSQSQQIKIDSARLRPEAFCAPT